MSSSIIYHQIALRFPKEFTGMDDDLYAIAVQAGDSNCYESLGRNARRSRSWQCRAFGTEKQILLETIRDAGCCEGGGLKIGSASAYTTPEQYITKVRNLIKKAENHNVMHGFVYFKEGSVSCHFERKIPTENLDEPKPVSIFPHEKDAIVALFSDEEFMKYTQTVYAHNFIKITGPEMR